MTAATERTSAANQARRSQTEHKLADVSAAISQLQRARIPITYAAIAARAGVSRTFLYDNPEARQLLADATRGAREERLARAEAHDSEWEASWRARALNAEAALRAAHEEIRVQRRRIGQLIGQQRAAERQLTDESVERITTENASLRQRVRELTNDNREQHEKLTAARSNARFLDRRVATLEAQLADALLSVPR
jgi:Family of unknown function (DUF6262)